MSLRPTYILLPIHPTTSYTTHPSSEGTHPIHPTHILYTSYIHPIHHRNTSYISYNILHTHRIRFCFLFCWLVLYFYLTLGAHLQVEAAALLHFSLVDQSHFYVYVHFYTFILLWQSLPNRRHPLRKEKTTTNTGLRIAGRSKDSSSKRLLSPCYYFWVSVDGNACKAMRSRPLGLACERLYWLVNYCTDSWIIVLYWLVNSFTDSWIVVLTRELLYWLVYHWLHLAECWSR